MIERLRPNAGIVVFNNNGKVLLCRRSDTAEAWQFPQGGIEKGETPAEAARRELKEETSLQNVILVQTLTTPIPYYFPPEILAKTRTRGWQYIGQEMYWSLFYFSGDEAEINLNTIDREFSAYQWGTLEQAYDLIIDFKKPAYAPMIETFKKSIAEYLKL
jgi:putative (di)nucleoside polyphosphate hydrolase